MWTIPETFLYDVIIFPIIEKHSSHVFPRLGCLWAPGRENCRAVVQGIWLPNLGGAWGEVPPGESASAFPILFVCQSVALRASCREEIN